ncbi:MAG: SEL1-like repeat protein [Deltaproteobacteria bacterium]|nr:SEL1-like repeat protein [Deltaproteobacteria bacterium]
MQKFTFILMILTSCSSNYFKELIPTTKHGKRLEFSNLKRNEYSVLTKSTGKGEAALESFFPFPVHVIKAKGGNYGTIEIWGFGSGNLNDAVKYAKQIALYNAISSHSDSDLLMGTQYRININTNKNGLLVITAVASGKAIKIKTDEELNNSLGQSLPAKNMQEISNSKQSSRAIQKEINRTLHKKCNNSDYNSCAKLAYRYYKGAGISKNQNLALQLFKKACNGGLKKACKFYIDATNPY